MSLENREDHQLLSYDIRVTTCRRGWSVKDAIAREHAAKNVKGVMAWLENCDLSLSLALMSEHDACAAITPSPPRYTNGL